MKPNISNWFYSVKLMWKIIWWEISWSKQAPFKTNEGVDTLFKAKKFSCWFGWQKNYICFEYLLTTKIRRNLFRYLWKISSNKNSKKFFFWVIVNIYEIKNDVTFAAFGSCYDYKLKKWRHTMGHFLFVRLL